MSAPHLISFDLCPYVQRAVIALREKGVEHEITYIDLAAKPDWFLAISPLGKVPVLKTDRGVLFESIVIAEYLDETTGARLHPEDPFTRAQHRAWIEVTNELGSDVWRVQAARTEEAGRSVAKALRIKLERLEEQIVGPLFAGDDFSLVDAAAAPMLQRLVWVESYVDLGLFDGLPKLKAWTDALLARDSVAGSLVPDILDRNDALLRKVGSWLCKN